MFSLGLAACSTGTADLFDQSGKALGRVDCKTEEVQIAKELPVSEVTETGKWYSIAELKDTTQEVSQAFSDLVIDAYSSAIKKACKQAT